MQLRENLSKTKSVTVDPNAIPVGFFQAQKGNAAERMVGTGWVQANWVHVVILSKTETGFAATDAFDVRVKGRTILPPLRPIEVGIHAARQLDQTLTADAKKLVDRIVKRLSAIPVSATTV